jgi:hypothetical protein
VDAENLAENLRKPVVVVRFVVMRGATTQYFSPALHISAGIRWETTNWIPTSQKTAGIHDPGLRITPGSDPDPSMIPGLAQPLLACCLHVYFVQVAVRVLPIATDIDMDDVDTAIPANKGADGAVNMRKP